ncbi:cytochrome P450, putative, partial [Ixodes scapularis]
FFFFFACFLGWFLVSFGSLLFLRYAARYRNYWKDQNVIHEEFSLIFAAARRLIFKPFHQMDQDRYRKFGKLFGVYEGAQPVLFVADPELVKRVLVKDFPSLPNRRAISFNDSLLDNMMSIVPVEKWRRIRPAASPAFSTGKLRKMNFLIADCARKTAEHLKVAAEKEGELDIKQRPIPFFLFLLYPHNLFHSLAFPSFLFRALTASPFGFFFQKQTFPRTYTMILFPGVFKLFKLKVFNADIFLYFKNVCLRIIESRKEKKSRQEDFLQLMMDAQDGSIATTVETVQSTEEKLFNLDSEIKTDTSFLGGVKALTEDEAMAQCLLFFIGGQDTTSFVISYTVYLLALHPEIQAKLREEADECFKQHGPDPSLDVVSKLKYLHGVVSESLRMFPPQVRIERSALNDYVLGDTGIKVPKGCVVVVPVYSMHHDPEYFPDPTTFDPNRFVDENIDSIRPYTYLPFGAGPRNCIGMRFALEAVKLSLLHSVHSVEFVPTKNTKVPLEFVRGSAVLSAKHITIGIRKRTA